MNQVARRIKTQFSLGNGRSLRMTAATSQRQQQHRNMATWQQQLSFFTNERGMQIAVN